jgi:PAS domain S-box-containing protein
MKDSEKTKQQLLAELEETRRQLEMMTAATSGVRRTSPELQHSEEVFSKAFHASPDMMIITSIPGGKYLEVNDAFARNVGYSREEIIGCSMDERNFFAYPAEIERLMELLRTKGKIKGEEFTMRVRSGEIQQWLCSAETVDIDGEKRMISVAADITHRKKIEKALDESEQILAVAFRSSPQAIGISKLEDGKFIEVNESLEKMSGYTREEMIGHTALELNMWEKPEEGKIFRRRLAAREPVRNVELMFRKQSGELHPILFSASIIKVQGDDCLIGSVTDLSDRWKMERALRESEEKFNKAFNSSPTAICLFGIGDGKFMEINDSYIRFTGYSHDEIIGHTPDDLDLWVYPEEKQRMASSLITTGKLINERIHSRMKSGEIRTGLFSAQRFEMNVNPHMILSITDITDQVKAEEAIASEAILRQVLIQNSRDGIVILDNDGKVYNGNLKFCEMLGYTSDEIMNLHVWDWENIARPEQMRGKLDSIGDAGDHFETQHRRKDGSIFDVEISTNSGVISGKRLYFCVCRDITERKLIEKALRESEEMFSKAFHNSPELIAITTIKDGKYIDVNENYTTYLGYTREELVGHTVSELGLLVNPEESADMFKTLKEEGKVSKKEYKFRTKSGETRTWLFSAEPLTFGGEPCLLVISVDMTEQKLIEAKVREAENLQQVEKLRRELLANVSHELRTPLAGIKGFTTMLLDYGKRLKADEKQEYLETIDKNADRMVELIEQLLEMSRLGAGMIMIRKKPTDVIKLCKSVIEDAKERTANHAFILDLPRRLPLIEIDDRRIKQVLTHVIDNAARFSSAGTEIALSVRKNKDEMLFCVTDHGSGIPQEDLTHIFDRMFIPKSKPRSGVSGTGLGLSICKGLIEEHNGRIWIESEEGVGSKCYFTLPLKPGTPDSIKQEIRD